MAKYIPSSDVKVTYHGVKVTYDEANNLWSYELHGKERSSGTLLLAKEAIDKPAPKSKVMKPFEAWTYDRFSYEPEKVTVTSVAEKGFGNTPEFWIKHDKPRESWRTRGQREKLPQNYLVVINDENTRILDLLQANYQTRERLNSEADKLEKQLTHPKAPKEEVKQ